MEPARTQVLYVRAAHTKSRRRYGAPRVHEELEAAGWTAAVLLQASYGGYALGDGRCCPAGFVFGSRSSDPESEGAHD